MSIEFVHDSARLVEVAFKRESAYGTYDTPDTQIIHEGGSVGRAHVPAQAQASASTAQLVVHNRSMRGIDLPFTEFQTEYGPATQALINEWLAGTVVASNEWVINDFPSSWSIGCNAQRAGGNSYWKLAGAFCGSVDISFPVGVAASARLAFAATSMVDPQTAPTSFPALAPATAGDGFILHRLTFKHSATTSMPGTSVPIQGLALSWRRTLIIDHASESTEPHAITPATVSLDGTINFKYSSHFESEFEDIFAKEADGGYTTRYLEFYVASGATIQRITVCCRMDAPRLDFSNLEDGIIVPVGFMAGGSDADGTGGAPTEPTIKLENV